MNLESLFSSVWNRTARGKFLVDTAISVSTGVRWGKLQLRHVLRGENFWIPLVADLSQTSSKTGNNETKSLDIFCSMTRERLLYISDVYYLSERLVERSRE